MAQMSLPIMADWANPTAAGQLDRALRVFRELVEKKYQAREVQISSPDDVAALVADEMSLYEQEVLRVFLLDTRNRVIKSVDVVKGSVNSAQVRIAELFRDAIRYNATAIILAHNHPSGDPTPSPDDIALTRQAAQAGEMLDITVLDHLVIGGGRWVSLKARGYF